MTLIPTGGTVIVPPPPCPPELLPNPPDEPGGPNPPEHADWNIASAARSRNAGRRALRLPRGGRELKNGRLMFPCEWQSTRRYRSCVTSGLGRIISSTRARVGASQATHSLFIVVTKCNHCCRRAFPASNVANLHSCGVQDRILGAMDARAVEREAPQTLAAPACRTQPRHLRALFLRQAGFFDLIQQRAVADA